MQVHAGLHNLAMHYEFLYRLCLTYRPKTKGKVERQIDYIRRSFFVPLVTRYKQLSQPLDLETLNLEFSRWLSLVANARVHGTTSEVPEQRLATECQSLLSLLPYGYVGFRSVGTSSLTPVSAFELESLHHTLSVYDEILEPA